MERRIKLAIRGLVASVLLASGTAYELTSSKNEESSAKAIRIEYATQTERLKQEKIIRDQFTKVDHIWLSPEAKALYSESVKNIEAIMNDTNYTSRISLADKLERSAENRAVGAAPMAVGALLFGGLSVVAFLPKRYREYLKEHFRD